jgi:RimJ/RimL family protein N-acetyltransferase
VASFGCQPLLFLGVRVVQSQKWLGSRGLSRATLKLGEVIYKTLLASLTYAKLVCMDSLIIREAQPSDAAPLLAYIQRLLAEPNINLPLTPDEFNFTVEEEQQLLADSAAAENSLYLIAEVDGQIVGEINCKGGQRQATRHSALLGLSVGQGWRNQGIGSALMARAVDWARATGIVTRLELQVYARNSGAIWLYEKFGFQVEGRRRQAIYQNGEYLDELVMALLL